MKIILFVSLVLLSACVNDKGYNDTKDFSQEFSKIDSLINRYSDLARFSGVVLVDKDGDITFNKTYGYANHIDATPFNNKSSFRIGGLSSYYLKALISELIKVDNIDSNLKVAQYVNHNDADLSIAELIKDSTYFGTDSNCIEHGLLQKLSSKSYPELLPLIIKKLALTNTHFFHAI